MATVNYIPYQRQSAVSLGKVAGYVSQDEKTQDRRTGRKLVSGVRCSSHFAVQEFRAARTAHHKKSPVWFYHYTQSFSPKEPITGPQPTSWRKNSPNRPGRRARYWWPPMWTPATSIPISW